MSNDTYVKKILTEEGFSNETAAALGMADVDGAEPIARAKKKTVSSETWSKRPMGRSYTLKSSDGTVIGEGWRSDTVVLVFDDKPGSRTIPPQNPCYYALEVDDEITGTVAESVYEALEGFNHELDIVDDKVVDDCFEIEGRFRYLTRIYVLRRAGRDLYSEELSQYCNKLRVFCVGCLAWSKEVGDVIFEDISLDGWDSGIPEKGDHTGPGIA